MDKGIFITFEGGEGSGKSTQAKLLCDYLVGHKYEVVLTREPGGTILAEKLRNLVVKSRENDLQPITEALIFLAARSDNLFHTIEPALEQGKIVICDRFHDSSLVYQGICQCVDLNLLNTIYSSINCGVYPDITFILDIDPKIGLCRSFSRNNSDTYFEQKTLDYHQRVRSGYLELSNTSNRYCVLNAVDDPQLLHQKIIDILNFRFFC